MTDLILLRASFIAVLATIAFFFPPFQLRNIFAAAATVAAGIVLVALEIRLRRTSPRRVVGAALGGVVGLIAASLVALVIGQAGNNSTTTFWKYSVLVAATYIGLAVGAAKGDTLSLPAANTAAAESSTGRPAMNILDTSVIIDGRIADISETGFLDGTLAIPQFVLRELQLVADSADSLKRNRGRRGLDVLQRLQKMPQLHVQIIEEDFPQIRDVDMKLVELGKIYGCKIVTNDFNLNKVAQLHGVDVLNINELANALKPIVLPGEVMRVFVLKEGKEYNQGVAYLDDGTMVVVDNARRMISKTIDISVTSVLQTTAGKMIFGRFDERTHSVYDKAQERAAREPLRESSAAAPQT